MSDHLNPGLLAQAQDLNKQALQGIVRAPEFIDAAMVGLLVAGKHLEGQTLEAGLLDLSGLDVIFDQVIHHLRAGGDGGGAGCSPTSMNTTK
ncbi:hypothetical protein KQ313_04900 [Synechococcus sp. CS-1325]|uniref:hypothetical protein n=1 Tax=Synechococcus sp. CS-1325 TaxID=2847979 RepID=UPI000DB12D55|nr:hypothetical protein [Synechococcus sp. CS-1325]MCT0199014.1 hypothetical protein [Synechococcus sp. CS-1325]PZV00383.1 MAG: hypothetical protein DCF24_07265 [Cyanobium sp.]